MEKDLKMLSQIDGRPLQSLVRSISVLVFCLLLTHSCRASDAVFSPVIRLLGTDRTKGGVTMNCESKGWPLKPEVSWLDIEGKVLPSGPTETVKDPDDLYTVSSTVTFEKRHINSFNCRVQQKNINETRETEIYIADDFFEVQSSFSATTIGLVVCLAVCILIILLLAILLCRQNSVKTNKTHKDETDNTCRESKKTEDEFVTEEEREKEPLRTDESVEMKVSNKKKEKKKSKHLKKQQQEEEQLREQQRREEVENVRMLKEELETKKNELKLKQTELQQLHEEKQRNETELQNLRKELQNKNEEVEKIAAAIAQTGGYPRLLWGRGKEEDQKKKREAEIEVEKLKEKLETKWNEADTKFKEFEDKQAEVQQLQDAIQSVETNLQTLMEELESNNMETESNQAAPVRASSSPVSGRGQFKWQIISRQKFQDEQRRREEAENKVQILEEELQTLEKQLGDQKQRKERAEKELNQLKKTLQEEMMKREKAETEVENLKKS